jgi:hypothetical protein
MTTSSISCETYSTLTSLSKCASLIYGEDSIKKVTSKLNTWRKGASCVSCNEARLSEYVKYCVGTALLKER